MDVVASSRFQLWWLVDVSVLYSRGAQVINADTIYRVGYNQKGDIVKELMQTAFDSGINMFDVSSLRKIYIWSTTHMSQEC